MITTLAAFWFNGACHQSAIAFAKGAAEFVIPLRPQLLQQHGFVHGGVLSYAADNALTFVDGAVLGSAVVTSEYNINYLKRELFVGDNGRETLWATALGTISRLSSPAAEP